MFSRVKDYYEIDQGDVVLQPWQDHPRQLISWLEMLQFSARMFFWCGQALQNIKTDCLIGSIPIDGDQPIFQLGAPLDDRARDKTLRNLRPVESEFRKVGLQISAEMAAEVIQALEKDGSKRENFQWLMDQIANLEKISEKEIKGKVFFYVPNERTKFLPLSSHPHLFGEEVTAAFRSAISDVYEAGTCLALARSSACVFHLMRVLEVGLTVLGKVFDVSLAHTNWAPAIEEIEAKIRNMHKDPVWKALPDYKQQQEFYAQAASHFGILKDAWRNYTMHARGVYTEEQAERMFENTKDFMQKLATKLHE